MNRSAFPRIARQLNYQRTLTSPVTARVDIPGLPYEAFDQSGAKVQPWSLLRLFESVRACTFWDYPGSSPTIAESLADFHVLLRDHFFFIVSASVTIDRHFYKEETPKFPLYVNATLDHVGRSSKRLSYRLHHPGTESAYATCIVDDVLVSSSNRKPIAYPDWWMKKYAHLCENEKSSNFELPTTQMSKPLCSSYKVNLTDIDTYKHTNWSAYVKFCFESIYKHVLDNSYSNINQSHVDNGVKSVSMVYKSESNLYDTLNVLTRENKQHPNGVYGDIVKEDGTICFQLMMDFFNNQNSSKL